MGGILGFSSSSSKSKYNSTDLVAADKENGLHAPDQTLSGWTQSHGSTKPWAQLFAADDDEMEIMTLQDMKRSLKKGIEKEVCYESSLDCSHLTETPSSVDSEVPSAALELLLEDSTSNSSDNMSLGEDRAGVSSSCNASRGLSQEIGAQIFEGGDAAGLPSRQRSASMVFATTVETEVEDDGWTLQKWQQLYHKQHSRRKRLQKHSKLQQEISESIGKVRLNGPPLTLLDMYAAQNIASEVESTQVASLQDSSLVSECKLIKEHWGADSSECKSQEGKTSRMDELPAASGYISQMSASLLPPSPVRLELEDDSEIAMSEASMFKSLQTNSHSVWAFKPCSEVQRTSVSKSASSQARVVNKPVLQTPSRRAHDESDIYPGEAHVRLSGQRKQCMMAEFEGIKSSLFPVDSARCKQQRISTMVPTNSGGLCNSKPVVSRKIIHIDVGQVYSYSDQESSRKAAEQLDGAISQERSEIFRLSQQSKGSVGQLNDKGLSEFPAGLNCMETLDIEEEQEPQQQPAKIPCKRKAISPLSQEFLLKASKLGECGVKAETTGTKRPPRFFSKGWVDLPKSEINKLSSGISAATERIGKREEALHGSLCHDRQKTYFSEPAQLNAPSVSPPSVTEETRSHARKIGPMLPNSPSLPHNPSNTSTISPAVSSPSIPAKGILRSFSQACQGPCGCEECASVRSRAERASEFSQRQMQDIEGLSVKLMKDLSTLRSIVEEKLIQSSSIKHQSPRPILSLEQLKKATGNALETEETAKKWLVRMARDCNRYCKIMRMQGRKLTFADESGGKLCHVKLFHSEPPLESTTGFHGATCSTSSTQEESVAEAVALIGAVEGNLMK